MPPYRETENSTSSLAIGTPEQAIRTNITQVLLRASKQDCNNSRNRFIPRAKLVDIINEELVEQLLQTIPGRCTDDASHRQDVVHLICSGPEVCSCGCGHCTGRRMILATLLLCGRADLILSFLAPANTQTCDNNLPLRFNSPDDFDYGLNVDEKELFTHLQWQVYTPFLTGITSAKREDVAAFPEEVSLPWMEKARIGEQASGEVSYVERIVIHHASHDLTSNQTDVFALKTFEQRLAPGLSEDRFRQEIEANLDSPEHIRIVRLLTAFSYRDRFYLLFPFSNEGSLETLWRTHAPNGIVQESSQPRVANWYSDVWLIGECLGIAEALVATHGLAGNHADEKKGLLHADIKPENILCFQKFNLGKSSIVLKLADFGEAKPVKSDLRASKVARVLTYRPPEHSPGNIVTLNYDVWCLGCLFLDFVNWAIFGQDGIDSFIRNREDEPDEPAVTENPGQIIEDTFFKRTRQEPVPFVLKRLRWGRHREMKVSSGRATTTYSLRVSSHVDITSRLKDAVVSRLTTLQQHARCSDQLKRLLSFVGDRMLVVDPRRRVDSREVRDYLRNLAAGR